MQRAKLVKIGNTITVYLLQKTKMEYYANLKENKIVDNKQFWKTIKLLLFDKIKSSNQIFYQRVMKSLIQMIEMQLL